MTEEDDDLIPPWLSTPVQEIFPGTYVWPVTVESAQLYDRERDKPYVKMELRVIDLHHLVPFRLYVTKAARGWATYFLRKFEYPKELLERAEPIVRASAMVGLSGKIHVEITDSEFGLKFDIKGFSRLNETELEERLKKEIVFTTPSEPTFDLEADVKKEPDLSWLDEK